MEETLLAGVPSRDEVRLVWGARRLGGEGAGVPGRGRRLFLGAFACQITVVIVAAASNRREKLGQRTVCLTSAIHVRTRPFGSSLRVGGSD